MTYIYIGIGGFLLGSFLYTAWDIIKEHEEYQFGFVLIGIGITLAISVTAWVDYLREGDGWFRSATLLGYLLIATGLSSIIRKKRKH